MFKFLKEKLKKAVNKFSKDVEAEAEDIEEEVEEVVEKPKSKKEKKPKVEKPKKEKKSEPEPELELEPEVVEEVPEEKEEVKEVSEEDKIIEENIRLQEDIEKEIAAEEAAKAKKEKSKPEPTPELEPEPEPEPVVEKELEVKEEKPVEPAEPKEKKKGFFGKLFKKKEKEEKEKKEKEIKEEAEESVEEIKKQVSEEKPEEPVEEVKEKSEEGEEPEEKKGFFAKIKKGIVSKKLSESKFQDLFFELEVALLENNVAVEVIERIKEDLKKQLVDQKLNRFEIEKIIFSTLKTTMDDILTFDSIDLIKKAKDKKPLVIVFVGVNGSGKTTTIGKIAKLFQNNGMKPVLVAADTFRAAAIQQLEEHANNLGVKIIKHDYGSDPAAVAFDGIKYAESKGLDVVLIDTAGRLHSNVNLMDEMKKIIRVAKPDFKLFIGESITGNDCVEQAQNFHKAVDIDGIVLSKADVDEKGGAAISVSYVTGKPILYLGTGQTYDDLKPFDKQLILNNLGL